MNKKVIIGSSIALGIVIILAVISLNPPKEDLKIPNQVAEANETSTEPVGTQAETEKVVVAVENEKPVSSPDLKKTQTPTEPVKKSNIKVEVFLFHATQRCPTCIAIGRLAGETVNEFFQKELYKGQIEFREINIDLPENKLVADKFQASGSALFINTMVNSQDSILEDTQVWRLTQRPDEFKSYLRNKINNLLDK